MSLSLLYPLPGAELDLDVSCRDALCGVVAFGVPVRLFVWPLAPTDVLALELYILAVHDVS